MSSQIEGLQPKYRNFICSCQKAYLSYAALFTHIKQKHGGKAPGQIVRPRSLNKRGRPRKNDKTILEKDVKSVSYAEFYVGNNLNLEEKQNRIKNSVGQGFTSYRIPNHVPFEDSRLQCLQSQSQKYHDPEQYIHREEDEQSMDFINPNNQLSSNTLALASIIIGLQNLFKDVSVLELVHDRQLQSFNSYFDLKQFHSKKLLQTVEQTSQEDAFLLGNIICVFLNFCHQTLEGKVAYQQIVLLMICFLEHIKQHKQLKGKNLLTICKKEVIHECLPSFFQQYLERVVIKSKLNFWIFKQNNSFKVLIWFLSWLSAMEAKHIKNTPVPKLFTNQQQQIHPEISPQYQNAEDSIKDQHLVEFEHPEFLSSTRKTQSSKVERKAIQKVDLYQKEESDQFEKEFNSSESERRMAKNKLRQSCLKVEEDDSKEAQHSDNNLISMERLSSEVR